MRAGVLAVAAAFASGVSAGKHHAARRHAHEAFHMERGLLLTTGASEPTCGCTTIYTTITGEGTIYNAPTSYSSAAPPPSTTAPVYVPTSTGPPTVPTPLATTCPTPGVYTIPAVTITVTEETTVCAETSTTLPASGTYTVGGVTTVVVEETTVVCPYATISTSGTVVTEVIETTTYVCPSAGTYTIAPLTTVCETETVWVYPTVASYPPGTYTQNEITTTITETDYVVFCPFTSGAPVATSAPAPAPPVSTTPASTPNTGSLGTSGNQWAITYSPYEDNGACKDAGSVASDIAEIAAKGFTSVRIYSTDCSGLENVGSACANEGLKLILGIFITTTGCSGAQQQVTDIITWGQWDLVELIVIGNEAVFSEYTSASELASFISSCKSAFSGAGYNGPCTTTEPLNIWQENIDVFCEVVDVVGCNIHPFFNADVTADQAGDFVASQLAIVDALCTGKYGVNLETGWPSVGTCNGVACPGPDAQATAVALISEAAGGKSVMFSFVNDYWKDPGAFGCEQSWGAIQLFGN